MGERERIMTIAKLADELNLIDVRMAVFENIDPDLRNRNLL